MFRLLLTKEARRFAVSPREARSLAKRRIIPSQSSSAHFSSAATLPPILPPPSPPQPETPVVEKGFVGKLVSRYSLNGQQNRIKVAEAFFQAATRQAANP